MASLKEIKGRIASVKSTLKITSAMKMVASAKLHKAQLAIEGMRRYQAGLECTLSELLRSVPLSGEYLRAGGLHEVALVCFSSNSSLCGGFNANAIRAVKNRISALEGEGAHVTVYSVGRKMAEAMRSAGHPSPSDWSELSGKPSYDGAAGLAGMLVKDFLDGKYDRIELIYNHFVSVGSQKVINETFLPLQGIVSGEEVDSDEYILEPGGKELVSVLIPKTLRLKIYTTLLDAAAAEHAARTVAMQMATDNGEGLLQELSLEYNKGRQQKITSEILDLVGGMQQ